MKTFRRKRTLRIFSVFALLTFLSDIILPPVSYGLTTGPHQPEYTSYEDANSYDMVNLLTGDFTFNMPVLSVPVGNEGDYTLPLSYHAGISPHQEASFVGLGFNINPGAITRNINGFPDDASGETQKVDVKDLTGRRGWYSNGMGWTMGWDSQAGHYGVISLSALSANWNDEGTTVGLAGIYVGEQGRVEPVELGMTIVRVVASVLSYGTSEFAAGIYMDAATTALSQAAMATSFRPPQAPGTKGGWKYLEDKDKKLFGLYTNYWYWLDQTRIEDMYGTLYLDKPVSTPYAGSNVDYFAELRTRVNGTDQPIMQFPKSTQFTTKGAASDVNINFSSSPYYMTLSNPSYLAYDNYNVNGPGISGNIHPYRFETGSVSVPREMSPTHTRFNTLPFLDYPGKVPFVYEGAVENRYFDHVGASSSSSAVSNPSFHFGLSAGCEDPEAANNEERDILRYELDDVIFGNAQRIRPDISTTKKLPQGNFVDWLTNGEIGSTSGKFSSTSYMDYFPASTRSGFRSNFSFGGNQVFYGGVASAGSSTSTIQLAPGQDLSGVASGQLVEISLYDYATDADGNVQYMNTATYYNVSISSVSGNQLVVNQGNISLTSGTGHIEVLSRNQLKKPYSIGGFVITSADGMNYHYSIPVYDYASKSFSVHKTDAAKNSTLERQAHFANTWLLTAITGPDFVDRGGASNAGDGYIDENDWGYWIKFNYGSYVTDYKWRFPYSDNGTAYTATSDDQYKSYSEGYKEKYYINSIETRSHAALFIKDIRKDAKDSSPTRKSSLRLSEIALLTKDSYKTLTNPATAPPNRLSDCSGKIDVLYQVNDLVNSGNSVNGTKATFIQQNAVRRIVFNNNDYTLCPGATNSDPGYGKLTLKSISVYGKNNAKVLPDYKFAYGNNPAYNGNQWDGWGMYSSSGTSAGDTHKASGTDSDGAAWSLTEITNPLGAKIVVDYERDTYASVSGQPTNPNTYHTAFSTFGDSPVVESDIRNNRISVDYAEGLKKGDRVYVSGHIKYKCTPSQGQAIEEDYGETFTITNVSENYITLNRTNYPGIFCLTGNDVVVDSNKGTVRRINKKGGNIRVASLRVADPGGQSFRTRYLYEKEGATSGVVSQEPDYIRVDDYDFNFYRYPDYPATPVLYSRVTVLSGELTNDNDYSTETVYEFETPDAASQYIVNSDSKLKDKEPIASQSELGAHDGMVTFNDFLTLIKFQIENRTSMIGKLKSIKAYDKAATTPYSSQNFEYTAALTNGGAANYQGVFSEGSLIHEAVEGKGLLTGLRFHRAQRTTVLNYPYTLKKITSTVDGNTFETTNNNWDLFTGSVVESTTKSPLNITTKTVLDPLYKVDAPGYSEFGSKAVSPSNLNMLLQVGATYTYRLDDAGKEAGLIEATANTWKKDWDNYRVVDSNGNYTNSAETDGRQVWRKHKEFVWRGEYAGMNADGTHRFTTSDKFNFNPGASNAKWQSTGAYERFNHSTVLLESSNMNNIYTSQKLGYKDQYTIASAVNARFHEIAYSSAEDPVSAAYFGGEVGIGAGTPVTTAAHSGSTSVQVSSGNSFVFKAPGLSKDKRYRASVWTNSLNGRIYYKINGGTEVVPALVDPKLVNGWYRVDLVIPQQTADFTIEVGVKSASGTVLFDDFRFQPVQATMTGYVYDPISGLATYILDNDNLFTRYEYNDRGLLIRTSQESVKYGVKTVSETRSDYRRFYKDQ